MAASVRVVGLRFSPQGFLLFRCVSFALSIFRALAWMYAQVVYVVVVSGFSLQGLLLSDCFMVFQWCLRQFRGVLRSFAVQSAVAVCEMKFVF